MKRASKKPAAAAGRRAPVALANPMAEQVGPVFHDENGMRDALAGPDAEPVSLADLEARCAEKSVLVVSAFDGSRMFPTWQISDGEVLAGLGSVLKAMDGQPAWSVALWITTPHEELQERTPRALLESGENVEALVTLAAETARRWS